MKKWIICALHSDIGCLERKLSDGSMIDIDCTAAGAEEEKLLNETEKKQWTKICA